MILFEGSVKQDLLLVLEDWLENVLWLFKAQLTGATRWFPILLVKPDAIDSNPFKICSDGKLYFSDPMFYRIILIKINYGTSLYNLKSRLSALLHTFHV